MQVPAVGVTTEGTSPTPTLDSVYQGCKSGPLRPEESQFMPSSPKQLRKQRRKRISVIFVHFPEVWPTVVACASPTCSWRKQIIGRKHPSRDVMFSGQKFAPKMPNIITSHDVLGPLNQVLSAKQVLSASRDVTIFWPKFCGSKVAEGFSH